MMTIPQTAVSQSASWEKGPDFNRASSQLASPFEYYDVALDSAGSNVVLNISGDFLYVDASSTGVVTMEINNQYNDPAAPFLIQAGFGFQGVFKQLKLSWGAQAGKKVRLMYSTGARIVPTNVMQIALNSAPRSSFAQSLKTVANTTGQLIAANSARSYLLIMNKDTSGTIYLMFGLSAATVANGLPLGPGQSYELNSNISSDAVQAIGSIASNTNVLVIEG
jgi:hypothetical protein